MREDRGWFCFPEVDIQIPFSAAMHLVLESISNPQSMNQLLYTGRRIGGAEAEKWELLIRHILRKLYKKKH